MKINRRCIIIAGSLSILAAPAFAQAAPDQAHIMVAVATNFAKAAETLAADFTARTGLEAKIISGSTGQLYAQIVNGAPYEVFLSADQERPAKLEAAGLATGRLTYARGYINLWHQNGVAGAHILTEGDFEHLAIANPALAPYGRAAQEVLETLGLWEKLQSKIVMGQNIGQAYALVASGNAELGFVDSSHVMALGGHWVVPQALYSPILQDAVRLSSKPEVRAFMDYLTSAHAQAIITDAGYGLP